MPHGARRPIRAPVESVKQVTIPAEGLRGWGESVGHQILSAQTLYEGDRGAAVVDFIGAADVEAPWLHDQQVIEQHPLAMRPRYGRAAIVDMVLGGVDRNGKHHRSKLLGDLVLELGAISTRGCFDDVVQDAGDDGQFIGTVSRKDHCDIRRVRYERHRAVDRRTWCMVLGGEGEGVIDSIAVAVRGAAHGSPRNLWIWSESPQRGCSRQ